MKSPRILTAMCGSFCTFAQVMPQLERLAQEGYALRGCMSRIAADTDTRFGAAQHWRNRLEEVTGGPIITTVVQAEPLGPKNMTDLLLVCPCTGNTLAKLANSITDTPVTMAVKSHLRQEKPVVLCLATNDALRGSAKNIGALLNQKNCYFVPFGQDDAGKKPSSLVADFSCIPQALDAARRGQQMQPLLF